MRAVAGCIEALSYGCPRGSRDLARLIESEAYLDIPGPGHILVQTVEDKPDISSRTVAATQP